MLHTETALHGIRLLHRKLADGNSFQLFPKSGKAATTKSDKAAKALGSKSKVQKVENDSSSCTDVQAKLDMQLADMCTLFCDGDGVYHLESNKFHEVTEWFTDRHTQLEKTEPTAE